MECVTSKITHSETNSRPTRYKDESIQGIVKVDGKKEEVYLDWAQAEDPKQRCLGSDKKRQSVQNRNELP